jgi:hypothetical protein
MSAKSSIALYENRSTDMTWEIIEPVRIKGAVAKRLQNSMPCHADLKSQNIRILRLCLDNSNIFSKMIAAILLQLITNRIQNAMTAKRKEYEE